jgi:hypothetical protein
MKTFPKRIAAAGVGAIVVGALVGLVPASAHAAAPLVVTVDNATSNEGFLECSDGFADPPCGTITPQPLRFYVRLSGSLPRSAVTIGWRLVPGTATAGNDYTGPTTGSVVIPRNVPGTSFTVPLVFDGFNESTEQFTVQLTSSSVPANISDTGTGTILDGTQIPADCTASVPESSVVALDCTGRPATQRWRLQAYCWPFGRLATHFGNTVTGNGRSSVDCSGAPISTPYLRVVP